MALSDAEVATLGRLRVRLDRDSRSYVTRDGFRMPGFRSLRAYYRGMQRLEQLGLAVPNDLRDFVTIVAWPRTYVDAIVARLRPQGFLLNGEADSELWRYWQANNLDTEMRMALIDMCVYGRGYLAAGTNEVDGTTPLLTVESPLQMVHEWSNRHRRVTAAARFYTEDVGGITEARATLYLPDQTVWLRRNTSDPGWSEDGDRDEHGLGRVPVEPLINRATTEDRYGESEMGPIIGLTDAAARALTNAQVATEVMSLPQRWAAGMTAADFKDPETGEALTAWEAYFGSVWATANKDAQFGQFSAADLNNFKTIVGLYAQLVAGVTGLPMRYLGQMGDNPASADSIRAEADRITATAEEKQSMADGPIESLMRTGRRIATGDDDPELAQLVTDWRPAATPSQAQATDAAVKMHAEGLYSRRQTLREMGKSPQEIALIEAELDEEGLAPGVADILSKVATPAPTPTATTTNTGNAPGDGAV